MRRRDRDIDRILTLLRNRIRDRGFTQSEVQERLGWGQSYISQLLTKQKPLRVEQVLMILDVIGDRPEDFWAEIYRTAGPAPGRAAPAGPGPGATALREEFASAKTLLECTVRLLKEQHYISDVDLARAIREVEEASCRAGSR